MYVLTADGTSQQMVSHLSSKPNVPMKTSHNLPVLSEQGAPRGGVSQERRELMLCLTLPPDTQ